MRFLKFYVVLVVFVIWGQPARAQESLLIRGTTGGVVRAAMMNDLENAAISVLNWSAEKQKIAREIDEARRDYWQAFEQGRKPTGKGQDYASKMLEKDYYFLGIVIHNFIERKITDKEGITRMDLFESLSGGALDGGIQPRAIRAFDAWSAGFIKDWGADTRLENLFTLAFKDYAAPLERSLNNYYIYAKERDKAEYLYANPVSPLRSNDPETFMKGWFLATGQAESIEAASREMQALKRKLTGDNFARVASLVRGAMDFRALKYGERGADKPASLNYALAKVDAKYGRIIIDRKDLYAVLPPELASFKVAGTPYGINEIVDFFTTTPQYIGNKNPLIFKDGNGVPFIAGVDLYDGFFKVLPLPVKQIEDDIYNKEMSTESLHKKYPGFALGRENYTSMAISGGVPSLEHITEFSRYFSVPLPAETLEAYEGVYSSKAGGDPLVIRVIAGRLAFAYSSRTDLQFFEYLQVVEKDKFRVVDGIRTFNVVRDAEGNVAGVEIYYEEYLQHAAKRLGPIGGEAPRKAYEAPEDLGEVKVVAAIMPVLIGGVAPLNRRMKYPDSAKSKGVQGRVIVGFVVDEEGNVRSPEVIKGPGEGCDEEAVRVIQTAKYKPGKHDGKTVKVKMQVPLLCKP